MPEDLFTPEQVAADFGVTRLALIRFAKKHNVPLIEITRRVYRLTPAAVRLLVEAAESRSASLSVRTRESSGSQVPSSLRARNLDDVFASVLALTTTTSRGKKQIPRTKRR